MKNHSTRRLGATVALAMLIGAGAVLGPVSAAHAQPLGGSGCDFDDDGYDDLALGIPGENVGGVINAGAVNVIYGSGTRLTAAGDELWHQDRTGIDGTAEEGDKFGSSVACGDFDYDGFDDLAVGAPDEEVAGIASAGAVHVLLGSSDGLTATGSQLWTQPDTGVGAAESGDRFGAALATGDFDDDVADDLAIGIPGEDVGTVRNAGAISVLYGGGSSGLLTTGAQLWHQDNLLDAPESDDAFGSSLVVGDFNADGADDLAVGVPEEGGTSSNSGAVHVLKGSIPDGLSSSGEQFWTQASGSVGGLAESGDQFGFALAAGDFDNDGRADLAVGVPGENLGDDVFSAGAVNVLYGGGSLLTDAGNQLWTQDMGSIEGIAATADAFGASLASGDFDNDGRDDLAVGVPGDNGGIARGGAVNVIYGANSNGLDDDFDELWHQNASLQGTAETGDAFGASLATGDFDDDGRADLAVGVPGEEVGGITSAGAANVIYGYDAFGLHQTNNDLWHQNVAGIEGTAEVYDRLGHQPAFSDRVFRIPYATGTNVYVSGDLYTHSPDFREFDLRATPNDDDQEYTVVAAADGWIVAIEESYAASESNEDDNNYVWISHPGGEWTKYTHLATGSVSKEGNFVGRYVTAGTPLGTESSVGAAERVHLHFEVARPDDPNDALTAGGFIKGQSRVPLICGIPGNVFAQGQTYAAGPC